ncbi:MAG: response regulator, partial [Gammaproteobacteria bacterium]
LKFTDKGKIQLDVEVIKEEFRFVSIQFTVKDTGIGMSDEVRKKLFNSFTQADASTTRLHGGSGLGLAICKRLVELMGGGIGVRSVEGKGSNFWFVLPMRKSLRDVPALRENLEDARILYFRKSQFNLDIHKKIEQGCKINVEVTDSLDRMVDLLKKSLKPGESSFVDLIVVDVTGSEFTAAADISRFKHELSGSFSQILAINALPALSDELKNAGADAVMLRPFNFEAFRQQIYRLLDIGLYPSVHEMPDDLTLFGGMFGQEIEDKAQAKLAQSAKVNDLKFSGRVLLAEDNPINRSVIEKMLSKYGLEVVTVEEGSSAIKLLKSEKFDLVFMDCQMPRMDGFEATKLWRAYEKEHPGSVTGQLPIIAITANAMREDRQQCIDAQMDDYLPKPISRTALGVVLKIWMPRGKVVEGIQDDQPQTPTDDSQGIAELDEATLMELKEVMDDDFDRIIHSYIKHSTELISEIKHLMNSGEVAEVKRLVHSFKSSSKNVGAIALGNMAYEIETQLTNGVEIDLDEAIKDLIISYDQVVKALEKWLSE